MKVNDKYQFFLLCIVFLCWPPLSCAAQNIAGRGEITLSAPPNYTATKGRSDASALADGKYASAALMWLDSRTLGWQHTPEITIDFIFDNIYEVGAIAISTGMSPFADVSLPANILVFASSGENGELKFVGDMMEGVSIKSNGYRVVKLTFNGKGVKARNLKLVIVAEGPQFFTDEIEIFPAKKGESPVSPPIVLKKGEVSGFIQDRKRITRENKFLKVKSDQQPKVPADPSLQGRLIIKKHSSPWDPALGTKTEKHFGSFGSECTQTFVTVCGITEYIAFTVMNNSLEKLSAISQIVNGGVDIELYEAHGVKTRRFEIVPDALQPLENGQKLTFSPGETKILIAALEPGKAGSFHPQITIGDDISEVKAVMRLEVSEAKLNFLPGKRLNVNVWAYFNSPFYKGREEAISADLLDHYVNTFTVPPVVAIPAIFDAKTDVLENYLKKAGEFKNILIYLNFRSYVRRNDRYFMSDLWKGRFLKGYDHVMDILKQYGIDENNVYLYPFDEVSQKEAASYFDFSRWIRQERKQAQLFVTVFDGKVLSNLQGDAAIFQLLDREAVLKNYVDQENTEKWMYEIMDFSKSQPPYEKYRLLGWKAYAEEMKGIGFWAYGDVRGNQKNTARNDFDGDKADYTVVYDHGPHSIIPSRRWEAFKAGIEDYMLLKMYALKYGEEKAQRLCDAVLAYPEDCARAEKARRQMIVTMK